MRNNVVILVTQGEGFADLSFGVKMASYFKRNYDVNVSLIFAYPRQSSHLITVNAQYGKKNLKINPSREIFNNFLKKNSIDLIYYIFNVQKDKYGQEINFIDSDVKTVDSIKWETVSALVIGPSYDLTGAPPLTLDRKNNIRRYLRYQFLIDKIGVLKKLNIYCFSEYSYHPIDDFSEYFEKSGLKSLGFSTGLGKDEVGIFLDENTLDSSENLQLILQGFKKSIKEKLEKELIHAQCVSLFYDSTDEIYQNFKVFYNMHKFYVNLKKYERSTIIAVGDFCEKFYSDFPSVYFCSTLNYESFQACFWYASKKPGIGACVGDQSLSETLSAGLIPFYMSPSFKIRCAKNLADSLLPQTAHSIIYSSLIAIFFGVMGDNKISAEIKLKLINTYTKNNALVMQEAIDSIKSNSKNIKRIEATLDLQFGNVLPKKPICHDELKDVPSDKLKKLPIIFSSFICFISIYAMYTRNLENGYFKLAIIGSLFGIYPLDQIFLDRKLTHFICEGALFNRLSLPQVVGDGENTPTSKTKRL